MSAPTRSMSTTMCGTRPGSWRRIGSRSGCGDHSATSRNGASTSGSSRTTEPVGGGDDAAAPQSPGLTALVALQQPAADLLDDRLRSTLLGEPFADRADAQLQLGVGVLGGVRDVGAHGGVGPGGSEDRLQEGHVHDGGATPRSIGVRAGARTAPPVAAYPSTASSHPVSYP